MPCTNLTADMVMEIVARYNRGETQHELAVAFEVAKRTISNIVTGAHWSGVTGIVYVKGLPRTASPSA